MQAYKVTASNMDAFYSLGIFIADDETEAIRQARAKVNCLEGLLLRAFPVQLQERIHEQE